MGFIMFTTVCILVVETLVPSIASLLKSVKWRGLPVLLPPGPLLVQELSAVPVGFPNASVSVWQVVFKFVVSASMML